jgi:hypothetical protein
MTKVGLKPLRKVLTAKDSGYQWRLTLECGHVVYQEHPGYGDPKNLKTPKSKRCSSCFEANGGAS